MNTETAVAGPVLQATVRNGWLIFNLQTFHDSTPARPPLPAPSDPPTCSQVERAGFEQAGFE